MKSKAKFDPKLIQQFLIDHAEKFVVGLVAVLFLFLGYQSVSVTLDKYKKSPDELKNATQTALSKIASGPGSKKADEVEKFPEYANEIDKFKKPIEPAEYPMAARMDWKPIGPLRLRDAPDIYPVEKLRAIAGRGAIYKSDGSDTGGSTTGKRWIVVTGLVPYKKQLAEYHSKFDGSALETSNDVPKYVAFFYQRAEVIPGGKEDPKWSPIIIVNAKEMPAQWGGRVGQEIADPRFLHARLTSPLPQVAGSTWGSEAVFPPQIPVAPRQSNAGAAVSPDAGGAATPRRGGMPGVRPGPPQGGGLVAPPGGGLAGDTDDEGGFLGVGAPKAGVEKAAPKEEEAEVPEYYLLRFFDFDVKPNTQYQYRVFLVMRNPNFELPANVLEEQELAVHPFIGLHGAQPTKTADGKLEWPVNVAYAKYSSPCESDRLSGDMRLLSGKVTAAKGPEETKGEVRILRWLEKSGRNGSCSKENLIRGTVLNFPDADFKVPGQARPTKLQPFNLNAILIDMQGGDQPMPKDKPPFVNPGLILVMDDAGNLVMHDEVAEAKEWDDATTEPVKQPDEPSRPGPRGPIPKSPDTPNGIDPRDLGDTPVRHGPRGR